VFFVKSLGIPPGTANEKYFDAMWMIMLGYKAGLGNKRK
jgi:hypothetical protein